MSPTTRRKIVNRNIPRTGQHDEISRRGCSKSYYKYSKILKEKIKITQQWMILKEGNKTSRDEKDNT